jgi:autotransporter-associated beta strand protein
MLKTPISKSAWRISAGICVLFLGFGIFVAIPRKPKESRPVVQEKSRTSSAAKPAESPEDRTSGPDDSPSSPAAANTTVATITPAPAQPQAADPTPTATDKDLPPDFLDRIVSGNTVAFTLPDGSPATGGIEMIDRDAHGVLFVQGRLTLPHPGFYFFQRQTFPGVAGPFVGNVRFDGKDDAWKIEPTGNLGAARLNARKLDEIICANYEEMPEAAEGDVENAPQTHPSSIPIPPYQTIIPLQSLPGATAVVYLDFDGEQGPFPGWGTFNALPANGTNTDFYNVWKMVCEDYQGFNLNVTTDRKVFDNAPEGRRVHCIITPTTSAAPGAGGVAYVGSFNWGGDRVCWAFYSTGKSSCEVISHEVGHTLKLSHDGRITPAEGYYGGHGTDPTGWAPIMGVGYYKKLSQWSKGEYLSANQTQDDLAIIVSNNDVDYRTDDMGDVLASARYLEVASNNTVSNEGIIEQTGDIDSFRFVTTGGQATINVNTVTDNPNLDILAEIVDSATSTVVTSNNPDLGINATVSANLAAGEYLLRIRGTGRGDPLGDGYTNYGCIGTYLVSGSVAGGIKPERFTIAENSGNGSAVGTVVPRNNHGAVALVHAISSGNTNGAFSINSATGAITVANSSALNYEALSLRWDDPATFELFVNITDASNPSLNENLRTVVTVSNLNETPALTGGAVSILEHSYVSSKVFKVTGSDPDRFDFPTYSITAGNTGNAFSIDSGTGQITIAANIDVAANTVYNLTIQASDQGTPALTNTANVAITVVNTADGYQPGRIVRTYFENITGGTVANLTGNARFPNNPDSEQFLTSFDGTEHGDNFGSTIRGYMIPPTTGTYQFWIASDDASELRIGTNATPASATVRASVAGWTDPYAWTANASQQSATISLTAGVPYYIEARHKEGGGGDHVAVAWTGPGITRQVISGLYLAPFYQNYAPKVNATAYSIRESSLAGQPVGTVTSSDVNAQDTFSGYAITAGNTGGVFGIVPATGKLYVAQSGLLNATTTPSYTLTIQSTDNGTPELNGTGTVTVNVSAAAGINVTGIVQEIWTGITGTALSGLTGNANYPNKANVRRALTAFDSVSDYADNYGCRIRAKFIPAVSGDYRFYVSGDDESRLLFSANESGAGAAQIANIATYTAHNTWTTYASQTSAIKTLVAGQAVYLEALEKEGGGGDHISVGYTGPDTAAVTVIPGSMLQPFNINASPVFSPTSFSFNLNGGTAISGTAVGTISATEPNGETLVFAITSGNAAGAFAINSATGAITVANPAALANGDVTLQVGAQDGGLSGVYPLASATATVVVHVTGINVAPVFTVNPFTKPNATEDVAYSQTIAGSATDANAGDTLTFSKTSGPAWLSVASNGALSGTPLEANNGANSFVVRVTDAAGLFAEATLNFTVIAVNEAPVFSADPVTYGTLANQTFSGSVTATDPDAGDTRTYSKLSGPAWLGVAANGTLSGTPLTGDVGVNAFTLRVTDAGGLFDDCALNVTVIAAPTWNIAAGGSWPVTGNWLAGIVANGTDATADFSTLDLTASTAVTLDGARTVGRLVFGDTTPSHGWTVNTGTAGPLTLAVSTGVPSIVVNNQTSTINAAIAGTQGVVKTGAGTLTLGGVNTFAGGLTVNAGTVKLAGANSGTSQAGTGTLTINSGTTVEANSSNSLGQATGSALSPLVINGGTFLAEATNHINSITLSGGTIGIRSGVTQVDGMAMTTRNSVTPVLTCLASATTSTVSSKTTLANSATFSVSDGPAATDLSVSGVIAGSGNLTKSGGGTMALTTACTYTGATGINQGSLLLTGSLANTAVTVAASGTLAGTGTITGTVANNGTISPGNGGPGNLTVNNSLTLGADSVVTWQLADWTGTGGSGYDKITANSLNITATTTNRITLRITGQSLTNFSETGKTFTLIANTGSLTGFDPAKFILDTTGFTNGAGTWAVQSSGNNLVLVYTRPNTVPDFTTDPILLAANEDQAVSGNVSAADPDLNETLTYSKISGPSWLTVSSAGVLGGTPANANVGVNSFVIGVSDSFNAGDTATLNFTVANTNDTPVFTTPVITGPGATQDLPYSGNLTGTATDPDTGDTLAFSKISGPAWLGIAANGDLTGTPANSDAGANSFTVRVTDGGGLFADATLDINVANVNDAPVFTNPVITGTIATQDSPYTGTLAGTASDPDTGDTLAFSKISGPAWLGIAANGDLTGTPANSDAGANSFTVRVTDGGALFADATLEISVANVNDAPVFTNPAITGSGGTQDSPYTGTLAGTATDPDTGDTLAFSKISGPAWLGIAANGDLTGTPANSDAGANSFTVRVTDGGALFADATLDINVANVNDAPVFTNPVIAGSGATQDSPYSGNLTGTASDPDTGDTRSFSKVSGPAWLDVAANGALTGTPATGDVGGNNFTVRVTDAGGLFAEAALEIQVAATAIADANGNGILDTWEIEKFGNADPGNNPADEDADHDGLSNLMEFAIGTHPEQSNASPLEPGFATVGPDMFLQLTVPKNPTATNIGYVIEVTGDPAAGTWSAAPTVVVSETATKLIVRDATPVPSAGKRFLRLKVHTLP